MTGSVVVVHNGIVENFLELREELNAEGVVFNSDTDSEVIVHLIERYLSPEPSAQGATGLAEATRQALKHLKGAHGVVVLSSREPDKIVAARIGNAGGVVIGLGEGENYVASDLPAILEHTRRVIFLESRQLTVVSRDAVEIKTLDGKSVRRQVHNVAWDPVAAEKGEYRHFMAKEIHEQVRSLTDTIAGRVDFENGEGVRLPELNLTAEKARLIQ
jgi:glucosamine--fructose-6-phosphate aminotransferase (isomerizing)